MASASNAVSLEGGGEQMTSTRFTDLVGCDRPLQLAGMGHVANVDLAAAVADAGGLGMLAVPMVPAEVLEATLVQLARSTAGRFGVSFLVPFVDPDSVAVAARGAGVVEWFYGEPDAPSVAEAHAGGALAGWQVGSVAEARAAAEVGCDYVVAQGIEAGGHVRGRRSLWSLLPDVHDAVEVPVVAAGGLGTARAVAAAFAAGADAVRIGTRLVAAAEADVHPDYAAALVTAEAADTELTTTFDNMWPDAPHRVLRSSIEAARAGDHEGVGTLTLGGQAVALPRFSPMVPTRAFHGEVGAMPLYAGFSVDAVHEVAPAAAIVAELLAEVESPALRR